ncbi:MAG: ATP-dependent RNA helicase HrpA [Byssovorax sp.]
MPLPPPRTNAPDPGPIRFPDELPISQKVREIAQAIHDHQVIIVAGETGSGKTTQIPKICLAMGRGLDAHIGCTQPRRIAATSVASRVASELGVELGREVGYKIRFSDRTSPGTYIKFMTDGILLAEIQGDPLLRAYDTLIIDEAHERNLNVDFLLGYLKRLLPRRPELRIIVSSATLSTERFSAFFGGAPVVEVSGRTYPVEVVYSPPPPNEADLATSVGRVVEEITELDPRNDILVFLPGEREIHETLNELASHGLPHTVLLPLYGRLSHAEQARVFAPLPERRIVLATNVAETSLTIPGIVYVVDTGVARVNRYAARTGINQLLVEPISRASADQRKGRAGRTRSGACFRLYEEQDYLARPDYTDPEIMRVGLAGVILQMKAMRLGEIEDFPFLDPPQKRAIDEGYRVLEELSALDGEGALTEIGKRLARLPLDPRIGRMVLGGEQEGALREVLIIASALGVQDPKERPRDLQKKADEAHRKFQDESSDFAGMIRLFAFFQEAQGRLSRRQLDKTCRDHFLSPVRMREWSDIHQQLSRIVREMGFSPNDKHASGEAVHRALLPGLLSRIGMWRQEQKAYLGARQTRFQLHPSSGLAKKPPAWIVAAELVETSQVFARTAARIEPTWLESAGAALCKKSYGDPHWEQKPAEVKASEHVTLYGLPIVRDRKVHYGPIDPRACRRLFILHALVRGEYTTRAPFQEHNQALFDEVKRLRDRARKSDMLADDHAVALFFEQRIPDDVYSGKTFEAWRKKAEADSPRLLMLSLPDILLDEAADLSLARFPEELSLHGARLPLSYRFDPGEDDDGITVTLPLLLLPQCDPGVLEWTIPGWMREKLDWLLQGLPKNLRKGLGSQRDLLDTIVHDLRPFEGPLLPQIARLLDDLTGVRVPASAFDLDALPPYLRFFFRVIDADGKSLAEGRDLAALQERLAPRARDAWARVPKAKHEKTGLVSFAIDALPERVSIEAGGQALFAYPALVDEEGGVAVRLLPSRATADEATRGGLRRLFLLALGTTAARLEEQVAGSLGMSALGDFVSPGGKGLRRAIAQRALDEAFLLADPREFPRDKAAFAARSEKGKRALAALLPQIARLAQQIGDELGKVQALLRTLDGKPGAPRATLDEVRAQLRDLLTPGLLQHETLDRLGQLPRYLRAAAIRLERLPNGPQKDQAKAEQVQPFVRDYRTNRAGLLLRGVPESELEAFRWAIEELRISLFAPELKTAIPISTQRLAEQWKGMIR